MRKLKSIQAKARICIALLIGLSALYLGAAIGISRWIDPYAMNHLPWDHPYPQQNPARTQLASYSFIEKAIDVVRFKPRNIILGTSVADGGFRVFGSWARWYDPDPAKMQATIDAIDGDNSYYNLALRGGGLYEAREYLRHAHVNNPDLSHVIVGVEFSAFTHTGAAMTPALDMIGRTYVPLTDYLGYSATYPALEKAWDVLLQDPTPANARAREWATAIGAHWNAAGDTSRRFFGMDAQAAEAAQLVMGPIDSNLLRGAADHDIHKFLFTTWFTNNMHRRYQTGGADGVLPPGPPARLREIVRYCDEHDIPLDIYLSPQHPFFWAMMRRFELEPLTDRWLREMAAIGPAWDFSAMVDFGDYENGFDTDTLHFSDETGRSMLPILRRRGENAPDSVRRVTAENVETLIADRRAMLDQWLTANPEIDAAIAALPLDWISNSQAMLPADWSTMLPRAYAPSYKGYAIIRFMDVVFAIPEQMQPPYDLYRFVAGRYPGMLRAQTLEEMLSTIDASQP